MKMSLLAVSAAGLLLAGASAACATTPRAAGNVYTSALNTLYAQGWHDVSHMRISNGMVTATAMSPHDHQRNVTVNVGAGTISPG